MRALLFLSFMMLLGSGGIVHAQGVACQTPMAKGLLLLQNGQDACAEDALKGAIASAEKDYGPEHPNVAIQMVTLAGLYMRQGQYAQAVSLYNRSLAIFEKVLGPDFHPHGDIALLNKKADGKTAAVPVKPSPLAQHTSGNAL